MKPLLAALLLALAPAASAEGLMGMRMPDVQRMIHFDESLGRALAQALASGAPADVDLLVQALSGPPVLMDPAGDWSCRTLKLGGLLPLTVYPPFRCRITETGAGPWRIEKLDGSQRLLGEIEMEIGGTQAMYTGVGFVEGGPAATYEELPSEDQTPREPGQTHAQVGRFEQAGPGQARLLLPAPLLESEFDILWLTR
jgi:hypothetical protein